MHHFRQYGSGDCGCGPHQGPFQHMQGGGGSSFGQGMPRRFMRPMVLLLLAEQPVHGYELMNKLKDFGMGQGLMDPSILYRMLRHLEDEGMAESTLDDSGSGPARKVYNLTPEGREMLDFMAAGLDEVTGFLNKFKERYGKLG
jgi:PadR family transcriptional regulator PadR